MINRVRKLSTWCCLLAAILVSGGVASSQEPRPMDKKERMMNDKMMMADKATVERLIMNWKSKPQETARKLIAKYGMPHEATAMRLIWHNNGPWKMTELVNEEIPHSFPKMHADMLLQVIDYRVPPADFDKLAEYDGSVIAERTKGEIGARCDLEEANFLALNLAHDIVTGKKSADEARKFYAEAILEMKHAEYKQGFVFSVAQMNQGDPDKAAMRREKP